MQITTKLKKKVYVTLLENLVRYGYDISEWLHPTYKNLDAQKCIDYINELQADHESKDYFEYEEKLTLEQLNKF
jgi:hypothetical protein